jgi:D-arabinose 1-dehydrogenase-like Zn-dependent alcohol dehydrogenase
LESAELPKPVPNEGEVRAKVSASGACRAGAPVDGKGGQSAAHAGRAGAREFPALAAAMPLRPEAGELAPEDAGRALAELKSRRARGAKALRIGYRNASSLMPGACRRRSSMKAMGNAPQSLIGMTMNLYF